MGVRDRQFGMDVYTLLYLKQITNKDTHSSVIAWRIPGTEEPGGLQSMRSHRVGHDCSDLAAAAAVFHI